MRTDQGAPVATARKAELAPALAKDSDVRQLIVRGARAARQNIVRVRPATTAAVAVSAWLQVAATAPAFLSITQPCRDAISHIGA